MSQPPFMGMLPLLEAVEQLERDGFTGALRVILPGEEVRVFIKGGEARFCTGSAAHHSFGAWLIRSGSITAPELKALGEKAQSEGSRLEDLLVASGRLTPEKLRASQQAMSHYTFADVAVRGPLDQRAQAADVPRVVDGFRLDPLRAIIDYSIRFDRTTLPSLAPGALLRLGPRFDDRKVVFERVFGSSFQTASAHLVAGGFEVDASAGQEQTRLVLALLRTGAAVMSVVVSPEVPTSARPGPLGIPVAGVPAGLLPTPGFPRHDLSRLADALVDAGVMPATAVGAGRPPPRGSAGLSRTVPAPTTPVAATRGRTSAAANAITSPMQELPALNEPRGAPTDPESVRLASTPGHTPEASLRLALEQAVMAAAAGEADLDGDEFAVSVNPLTGDPVHPRSRPSSSSSNVARPADERPGAGSSSGLRPAPAKQPQAWASSVPPGVAPKPPAAGPPSGTSRASARPTPEDGEFAEVSAAKRALSELDPLRALGLEPGAPLSAIREAYVSRRARFDPARFSGRTLPTVVRVDLDLVAAGYDKAYSDLTSRDRRTIIEAAAGGMTPLEISNYFGADQLFRDGRRAYSGRDFKGAHQAFLKAWQRWPKDADYPVWAAQAHWDFHLGEGTWGDGARSAADRLLRDALSLASTHELAHVLLARLELERGNGQKALELYRTVVDLNPTNAEARAAVTELAGYANEPASGTTGRILGGLAARLIQGIRGDKDEKGTP